MHMHQFVAHATTHHSSCHESDSGTPKTSSVRAHPCDHSGETTPGITAARPADNAVACVAVLPASARAAFVGTSALATAGLSSLPDRVKIRLATPLRVQAR